MNDNELIPLGEYTPAHHVFRLRNGRPPRRGEVMEASESELVAAGLRRPRARPGGQTNFANAGAGGASVADQVDQQRIARAQAEIEQLERLSASAHVLTGDVPGRIAELRERVAELEESIERRAQEEELPPAGTAAYFRAVRERRARRIREAIRGGRSDEEDE